MSKRNTLFRNAALCLIGAAATFMVQATKLADLKVVDKDYLLLHFTDGEVEYHEPTTGPDAYTNIIHDPSINSIKTFGSPLNTSAATNTGNWVLKSSDDGNYSGGKKPTAVHRKTKMSGQAEFEWTGGDYRYEYVHDHWIYLKLPQSMQQGKTYTLEIDGSTNSDVSTRTFTYDIFSTRSEAIHVNLVGYASTATIKAADLYLWMGDGGGRDFSWAEDNKVYIYDVASKQSQEVGTVTFWQDGSNNQIARTKVWNADFTGFNTPGTYRLAIEGVGCSEDFRIASDIYYAPDKVSTQGFFYMRIGQETAAPGKPTPRRPLYLPNESPSNTVVYITDFLESEFPNSETEDYWDKPSQWAAHKTGRTNPNAWGGHTDALDWDRNKYNTVFIYDMLLPFILTNGAIDDDNLHIAESGNGIPDVLDEARFAVDFWLRLRDGAEFSEGITNPTGSNELYQAGTTKLMAWVSAANAAMLADCFRISGHTDLMNEYKDSALAAIEVANGQDLDEVITYTDAGMKGRDLWVTAAAHLYNITGDTKYEDIIKNNTMVTGTNSPLYDGKTGNQLYAVAAYLHTPQTVNYQNLWNNMKASVIDQAKAKETHRMGWDPMRRSSHGMFNYWWTSHAVQHTIVAHSVAEGSDKLHFVDALMLEADWGLGRNTDNRIMMTTASTSLESKRSVVDIYTSGQADGVPGLHPGHTPYLNHDCWYNGMVMGCPPRLFQDTYPSFFDHWPKSDGYFPTRYAWAHGEFTPRQTMRGKQALYGYLYGLGDKNVGGSTPNRAPTATISSPSTGDLFAPPAEVTITAEASDIDGSITKVEFYNGSDLLGSDDSSPYSYSWTGVEVGTYDLTAKAFDDSGATNTSEPITIIVGEKPDYENLITNGDFTLGSESWTWYEYTTDGAAGTLNTDQGAAAMSLNSPGTAGWHMQLNQENLPVNQGDKLHLFFDAKGDADQKMNVVIKYLDPDVRYLDTTITLSSSMQNYHFIFDIDSDPANPVRLEFNLGTQSGAVEIDDVILVDNADADIVSTIPAVSKGHVEPRFIVQPDAITWEGLAQQSWRMEAYDALGNKLASSHGKGSSARIALDRNNVPNRIMIVRLRQGGKSLVKTVHFTR